MIKKKKKKKYQVKSVKIWYEFYFFTFYFNLKLLSQTLFFFFTLPKVPLNLAHIILILKTTMIDFLWKNVIDFVIS